MPPMMPGMTPQAIAQMLMQNPQVRSNPQQMQMLQAILNNDVQAGTQLAQNFCQTYGVQNPQQAAQQAQNWFRNNMPPGFFGR